MIRFSHDYSGISRRLVTNQGKEINQGIYNKFEFKLRLENLRFIGSPTATIIYDIYLIMYY